MKTLIKIKNYLIKEFINYHILWYVLLSKFTSDWSTLRDLKKGEYPDESLFSRVDLVDANMQTDFLVVFVIILTFYFLWRQKKKIS